MMDSVTRFAMAQREVGLAAGEPPTAKGYPPSVFALLPSLLERAGNLRGGGSITAIYPCSSSRATTRTNRLLTQCAVFFDGHIVLSRDLASRNHYPAIDILQSVSRTMPDVTTPVHRAKAGKCASGSRRCATARTWSASAPTCLAATRASIRH